MAKAIAPPMVSSNECNGRWINAAEGIHSRTATMPAKGNTTAITIPEGVA
jgi:hypothetical protein